MSGFDTGVARQSIASQAKQYGSVLRGMGPPVPVNGVAGDLYINVVDGTLYERRSSALTSPWGRYLFQVPAPYVNVLKWFSASKPRNSVGVNGDYCLLWGTYNNYGVSMRVWGPKAGGAWLDATTDIAVTVNQAFDALVTTGADPAGLYLTGQVQKAAIQIFPTIPPASWATFVTTYVGDPTATDDSYQTVFVTSTAPINGQLWQLMYTYLTVTCGFTPTQANTYLNSIWDLAATLPR